MKKLIFISLICFLGKLSHAQLYPTPYQNLGSINIAVRDTGGLFVRQTFVIPIYTDTTNANNVGYPKNYKGSMIFTSSNSKVYVRDNAMLKWNELGGGTLQGLQSVLDVDNLQTRDDSIRARNFDFTFDSVGNFKVNALSSVNLGFNSTSGGSNSTVFGVLNTASGSRSTAMGLSTTASGLASFAVGANTGALNSYAIALGHGAVSNGIASYTLGEYSQADGNASFVLGSKDSAMADSSGIVGVGLSNSIANSLKLGYRGTSNLSILKGNNLHNNVGEDSVLTTDVNGNVKMKLAGGGGSQGLQDVITVDNVLTQNNTIDGGGFDYVDSNVAVRKFDVNKLSINAADSINFASESDGINILDLSSRKYGSIYFQDSSYLFIKDSRSGSIAFGLSNLDLGNSNMGQIDLADTASLMVYKLPKNTMNRFIPTSVNGNFADDYGNITISSGGITSLNALTGATQTFATGTAGTDFAISSSGTTHTFDIPDASATARGLITTGTQTIAGNKTFSGTTTIATPFTLGATSVTPTGTELNYVDGVTSAIQTQLDTKWGTGGNAGLSSTNYIGTSDAQSLYIKANATTAIKIDSSTKQVLIGGEPAYKPVPGFATLSIKNVSGGGGGACGLFFDNTNGAGYKPCIQASGSGILGFGEYTNAGAGYNFNGLTLDTRNATASIGKGSASVTSALLELTSTTKGLLVPRMTAAQRAAISSPATSLIVYDSDSSKLSMYADSRWNTIPKVLINSASLNFGSIAHHSEEVLTITVTGAADGDVVSLGVPNASNVTNVIFTSWVSAANTVSVKCSNLDASASVDPASGTFKVSVLK